MGNLLLAVLFGTIAPLIVTVVLSMVANNSRKKEARMDAVNFVVRESKASVGIGTVLLLIGCAILSGAIYLVKPGFWASVHEAGTGVSVFTYLGFAFLGVLVLFLFFGLGSLGIYSYYHKRLVVMGDKLLYYPLIGKSRTYGIGDITKVVEQPAGYGQIIVAAYINDNKLFHFDSTNPGYGLLKKKLEQVNK